MSGYKNEILVVNLVKDSIGIQIICDATESVYAQLIDDMMKFIQSINFK